MLDYNIPILQACVKFHYICISLSISAKNIKFSSEKLKNFSLLFQKPEIRYQFVCNVLICSNLGNVIMETLLRVRYTRMNQIFYDILVGASFRCACHVSETVQGIGGTRCAC